MDREIVDYIEKNIIPRYDDLDEGHDRRHVSIVVENSLTGRGLRCQQGNGLYSSSLS